MKRLLPCLAGVLALCGCSTKPEAAPNSGFLQNPELMKENPSVPVQRVWKDPSIRMMDYDKIIVRPVRTDFQIERSRREKRNMRNLAGMEETDIAEFAQYMQNAFKEAIKKGPCRLSLAENPGPKTLSLEIALVKVVQAKPAANAAKTALSCTPIGACLIPVKYVAHGTTDGAGQSSLAIEGRLVDSVSGHVVAMFAQRSKQCTAVLNFEDYSTYGNLHQIVDKWAAKFVEIANARPLETGTKIEAESNFTFINF